MSECLSFQEATAEDGWGSWGETDPVGGHVLTSGTAAQSLGEDPVRLGLAPQPHRCVCRMTSVRILLQLSIHSLYMNVCGV